MVEPLLEYDQLNIDEFKIPKNYILLENELLHTSVVEGLMENFTQMTMDSLTDSFIHYLVYNNKIKITSVRKVLAIGLLLLPFMGTVLAKAGAKVMTIVRANGFSLGMILGVSIGLLFGDKYGIFIKSNNQTIPKLMLQSLASNGFKAVLRSNPKVFMLLYALANKMLTKVISMPQHDQLIDDFVQNSNVTMNPKEIAQTFLKSLIVGLVGGVIASYYLIAQKNNSVTPIDMMDNFETAPDDIKTLGVTAMGIVGGSGGSIAGAVGKLKPKSDKEYKELLLRATTGAKTKQKAHQSNISTINIQKHKLNKTLDSKTDIDIQDTIITKISQAVFLLESKVQNFGKVVKQVRIALANEDNAYVMLDSSNHKKCTITFLVNYDIKKSIWYHMTIKEIAAVLAHEYGHFIAGAFSVLPIAQVSAIAIDLSSAFVQDSGMYALINAAKAYSIVSMAKLAEIQADSYAIKIGFGKELASSLKKLTNQDDIWDEFGHLTTHGGGKSRAVAIEKYADKYNKLKKKLKE